jgi:hypothetical protein
MIRTSSRSSFAVLVHWVKNLVYLLYARLGIVSHIISVFIVRFFLTGKVPRLITRDVSQPLCRQLLPRRTGFNEGICMWDLWCTKWHTGSSFSKLFSFRLSIIAPIFRRYTQSALTYQKNKQAELGILRTANPSPHQISTQKIWISPKT